MSDQATELRRLVSSATRPGARRQGGPTTMVISGGRPGVGATTLASHLAATLAQDAMRIVLIDADLYRADLAACCGLTGIRGIGDVLAGRKSIHEVLQRGAAGMQILAGTASAETRNDLGERAIQRLLRQMQTLGPHADWLLVDAGNQPSEFAARLWAEADRLLLVTSPDAVAVMDTYALIKTLLSRSSLHQSVALVVNHATDDAMAADVHRRIDQSCQRFLGISLEFAGGIPHTADISLAAGNSGPLAAALTHLVQRLFAGEPTRQPRLAA